MLNMMINWFRLNKNLTIFDFFRNMSSFSGVCRVGAYLSESTADFTVVCFGTILKWTIDMFFVIESSLVDICLVKVVFFLIQFSSLSKCLWISYIGGFVHSY